MKIAGLAGGVGGSKLALGLYRVMDPAGLTLIVNTGDDIVMHGLHVSPDPDIIIYTLAGVVNEEHGWGIRNETFHLAEGLKRYGRPTWFNLGDRDLATHVHRSALLKEGATLSQAIDAIRKALGVSAHILPMSDHSLRGISFEGVESVRPAPGVLEAIADADGIVICPSNPLISIGPILAVRGVREALRNRREDVVAICPLVGGKSLKGPSDKMMSELGYEVSAAGVASLYRDFCGTMMIDDADEASTSAIKALDMRPVVRPTVMRSLEDKERLAREVLALFAQRAP